MAEAAEVIEETTESTETTEVVESKLEAVEEKTEVVEEKPVDWRSDLPEDLKKTAERFSSKEDAVRAIVDFRKRESQVRVPGKNASEDEISAYHKAIGVPETAEYEFPDLPEGQELTDAIKASREVWSQRFHSLNIPNDVAKKMSEMVNEDTQMMMSNQIEADKAFAASEEEALRSEWKGDDFDKNKTMANRALGEIANRAGVSLDDLTKVETKDGRFLMDRADMMRVFAVIGREMGEGTLGPALSETERDTVEDEVRTVREQIAKASATGDSKRANSLYQKELALVAKIEGNQSVVGAGGRSA